MGILWETREIFRNINSNMKSFKDFMIEKSDRPITGQELKNLEKLLDSLFSSLNVDIEFTKHFLDRLNDPRNGKQITKLELAKVYTEVYKKYGKKIADASHKKDIEKIIKSLSTSINIPVVLKWNNKTKEIEMVAKTIMRKRDFKSKDPILKVEIKNERV